MKLRMFVAPVLLTVSSICVAGDLPNPALTPGAINPDVTQANVQRTICVRGWAKATRPPAYYTNRLKRLQIRQYGYADVNLRNYEEDHLIPISVGGHPFDPRNLWPEPRTSAWGAARKDEPEFALYKAVCHGEVSLTDAQRAFTGNWIAAYRQHAALIQRYKFKSAD